MNEIIQTKVDEKAINEIYDEITRTEGFIESMNKNINYLIEKKKNLLITYFCGKKIVYEHEEAYTDGSLMYDLFVDISNNYRVKTRAYTSAHDMITFVANIEGHVEDTNIQFNIKTFDEAKQICRQWLADLIYDKYQ